MWAWPAGGESPVIPIKLTLHCVAIKKAKIWQSKPEILLVMPCIYPYRPLQCLETKCKESGTFYFYIKVNLQHNASSFALSSVLHCLILTT